MRAAAVLVLLMLVLSSPASLAAADGPGDGEDRSPSTWTVDQGGGFDFTTIQAAIDAASPGDTVWVNAGQYNETLVIDKSITLVGNYTRGPVIHGPVGSTLVTVTADDVTLDRLDLYGYEMTGLASCGIDIRGVRNASISNCSIHWNIFGIRGDRGASGTVIRWCELDHNDRVGIWLEGDGSRIVDSKVFYSGRGISVAGRAHHIENCTVYYCDVGIVVGTIPDRVLMMGNSYTNANSLDNILQGLLGNIIPDPDAQRLTSGGLTLADHATYSQTPGHSWNTTLNGGTAWKTLVLQDQSQIPGFPTTDPYWQASLEGARVLDGMADEVGADTVLMMTWGRRDGDSTNPSLYPNFTVMQDRLEAGYLAYAENLTAGGRTVYVSPVGLAFKRVYDDIVAGGGDPLTPGSLFYSLYAADGSHPSLRGSYLAACVLYATLTGNCPIGLDYPIAIGDAVKLLLEEAAWTTVDEDARNYPSPSRVTFADVGGNRVSANGRGIVVGCVSKGTEVTYNILKDNSGPAIEVLDPFSGGNLFVMNGFKDNNVGDWQVVDRGTENLWDIHGDLDHKGNWWSDYEYHYPNATNDGIIWDTPYHDLDMAPLVDHWAFPRDGYPVADAGPDMEVDENQVFYLDGSNSTDDKGIINWTWSFQDGEAMVELHGANVSTWIDNPGVYRITLVVIDTAGHWDSDVVNVTVKDLTPPTARMRVTAGPGGPNSRTFNGTLSYDNVGVVYWTWTLVGFEGPIYMYADVVDWTFPGPGVYRVELEVTDAAGNNDSIVEYITIPDTEDPVADAGPDQEVDMGALVTFDGSASTDDVGIVDYRWSFLYAGVSVFLSGPSPAHHFELPGRYTVALRVTDMSGNTHDDQVLVVVRDTEPPVADAGNDQVVVQGASVTLDGGGSTDNVGIAGWAWEFQVAGVPRVVEGVATFDHVFTVAGEYVVTLTVVDAAGNTATDTVAVRVLDTEPPLAVAGVDLTVGMDAEVHLDGGASSDNVGITDYLWTTGSGGNNLILTEPSGDHAFHVAGTYVVTLTVRDAAGNQGSDSITVTVLDTEPPLVTRMSNRTVDVDERVELVASALDNEGVVKYEWLIVRGEDVWNLSGARTEYAFNEPGDYRVTLLVSDANGNHASTSFVVHVRGSPVPWPAVGLLAAAGAAALLAGLWLRRRGRAGEG